MKNEELIRDVLIDNTIALIAEGGFEAATTRAIAHSGEKHPEIKMNEIYIYRLFGGKEELYATAFARLNHELYDAVWGAICELHENHEPMRERCYIFFDKVWRFLLSEEAPCRCYTRYYYSIYFKGETKRRYNEGFARISERFSFAFKPEADVLSILHSAFTSLLDFAIRVYNGDLEANSVNEYHIFNVIYNIVSSYFRTELLEGIEN